MAADAASATVFVVDDDQGLLRLIQKTLQREGFEVTTASSGQDAIAWLAKHHPDLLLLDLKLRDFEGKDLIARLQELHRMAPFIVITGQGDERVAVEMMKSGAMDYVVKDANFIRLVPEVVRRALDQLTKEKRLAEAEAQARLGQIVVEQGFSAVLITGTEPDEPIIVYINAAFSRLTGCSAADVIGKPLRSLENFTSPMTEFRRALQEEEPFSGERVLRSKDGEQRIVDCHIAPVLNSEGHRTHWVVIQRDRTDLKQLEKEVLEISDREQRRMGQDLHDGLGQQLTAIELMCESMRSELATARPELEQQAARICHFLREAVAHTRLLAHGLAPFKVEIEGLETALRELAAATSEHARIHCTVYCPSPVKVPDRETAGHLYRIAQEAVNNALKHAQADEVAIRLEQRNGILRLRIADNGKGLPPATTPRPGIGLHVMKHRASLIGAELELQSRKGKGLVVTCTLRRNR